MPNHFRNVIKMKGIAGLPLYTEGKDLTRETVQIFDFNKIILMPESLNVEAGSMEDLTIGAVVRKLNAAKHPFAPRITISDANDERYRIRLANCGKNEDELVEIGLQYITNIIHHGAATWYDWCSKNWGTKWNAYETGQRDADTLMFTTAWAPPEPVITQLSKMYPEAVIEHWWASEICGEGTGYAKYSGGKLEEAICF